MATSEGRTTTAKSASAQVLVAPDLNMTTQPSKTTAEAVHLRRLIERQPSCLMRVGIDGLLLAVNEVAVRLLGSEELSQVLGRMLTERIVPDHHERWREFAARVGKGASGTIECDLVDLSGIHRTVVLQGIPLLDHPDGIPSMILAARDTSAPRRLEAALQEREASRQHEDLRTELEQALAERQRLGALLREHEADRQRLMAEHAQVQQNLAEEHQLALLLKEREVRQMLANLRAELGQALADHRVDLQSMDENARNLEPLAAAGRLALEVGRELQTVVAALAARARSLLAQCPPEAADRQEIEALRGEAIRAASLTRYIVQGNAEPATVAVSASVVTTHVNGSSNAARRT